jgi:hypothetical protein
LEYFWLFLVHQDYYFYQMEPESDRWGRAARGQDWEELHKWARWVLNSQKVSPRQLCEYIGVPYSGSVNAYLDQDGVHYPPATRPGSFGARLRSAIATAKRAHEDKGLPTMNQNITVEQRFADF